AHDVGFLGITQANDDIQGVLAEITAGAVDLKLLAIATRKNLELGADSGFVISESLEREPQPVILIGAFIAQKNRRPAILHNQQICSTVAVVVTGNDGARIFQLNLVEANVGSDVFETVGAEIAEQAHFSLAFFRFADSDQVDPAIVVVVEGSHAVSFRPVCLRQLHRFEALAVVIAPEANSRLSETR